MNSIFLSVFKVFFKNIFSFGAFFEDFKKGPKKIIKNILIILLTIYCVGVFGGMYGIMMFSNYHTLEEAGRPEFLLVLSMLVVVIVTFVFGFLSIAGNYYTGCGEEQFLAMPISSKAIFGAKFAVSCVTDAIFGLLLYFISGFIYGYNQHLLTHPSFYFDILITGAMVSVLSVFLIYLIMILMFTIFPELRKKSFLSGIASVLVILFAVGYSFLSAKIGSVLDGEDISDTVFAIKTVVTEIVEKAPWLLFFTKGVLGNWFSIFVKAAILCFVIFVLVPLISKMYIKSLNGFGEIKTKKIDETEAAQIFEKKIKRNSVLKALYFRDVKTVFREPAFFTNGPLIILVFPIIILVSTLIGLNTGTGKSIDELRFVIRDYMLNMSPSYFEQVKFYIVMVLSGFIVFIGNATSIAATSFSREGKCLYDLKAMPIESEDIVKAKFWHAMTYVFIAIIVVFLFSLALIVFAAIPLESKEIIQIFVYAACISIVVSMVLVFVEMFVDTANPKLLWENPVAAFKQNVNSVIAAFVTMAVIALFVVFAIFFPKNQLGFTLIILIFGVISAPLGYLYFRYAKKRITVM